MFAKTLTILLSLALWATTPACSSATADPAAAEQGIAQLGVTDLAARLDGGARLVDVREPAEYERGHVPGAELVPLGRIAEAAAGWDRTEPLLLICRSGNRSMVAARRLQELGFTSLVNVQGGMLAWRGPVVTGGDQGAWK